MMDKIRNWNCKNTGLLLIRLGVGAIFLTHGVSKLSNMDGVIGFFASLGIPAFMAWVVAIVEAAGGLALILGVFTKISGVLLAITMLVAILKVKFPQGGFNASEFELILLLASLGLSLTGPGKFALKKSSCECVDGANCDCKK
ncbi:MAG TPA: DoxX family protein [Candidatus Paceibacterota bacterium]|nr:DoxX family protein [Candidatus Paceibacterota bacterium]